MTGILARYIARLLLVRLTAILVGLTALLILLDFLADGDQALAASPGTVAPAFRYIGLRLPATVSMLIPIAALLAGLLTFAELTRHRELAVIFSAGMSRLRLVLAALPVAVAIAAVQFLVENHAVPPAATELRQWGIGDYEPRDPDAFSWIRLGTDIVRYRPLAGDELRLAQITIYRRDSAGSLLEAIEADMAAYEARDWMLYGVRRSTGEQSTLQHSDRLSWPHGPDPSLLAEANTPPGTRSFADLAAIVARTGLGDYPLYVYQLALNERLMRPAMTVLLVILSVALARPLSRGASVGLFIAAGAVLGALGWMAAELLTSVGGLGLLPPVVAAWAPVAVIALVIGFAALHDRPGAG